MNKLKPTYKRLFKTSLLGIGIGLVVLSVKGSFGGELLAILGIMVFVVMLLASFGFFINSK